MAVNCISLLCEETVITQEVINPNVGQLSLLENIDVYMELSAPSAVVAGMALVPFLLAPLYLLWFNI
jgi:neurofibromin 1